MIKVLLVDDEEWVLEALEKNIRWKECGVDYLFKAWTMDDALQYFSAYVPDIVVTDIEMPDGSGLELMERIKEKQADTACLCLTCHPEFDYMRKAMQLGSIDYLLKPVEYEEVERVLKKLVGQVKARRAARAGGTETEEGGREGAAIGEEERLLHSAKEYIRMHLIENINVQDMAGSLHCSASHLMHSFKKSTGKTVIEYVTAQRMEKAKQLLRDSALQVNMVAELVGYEDYSYFSRVFKKETGETPREYRLRYRTEYGKE